MPTIDTNITTLLNIHFTYKDNNELHQCYFINYLFIFFITLF